MRNDRLLGLRGARAHKDLLKLIHKPDLVHCVAAGSMKLKVGLAKCKMDKAQIGAAPARIDGQLGTSDQL